MGALRVQVEESTAESTEGAQRKQHGVSLGQEVCREEEGRKAVCRVGSVREARALGPRFSLCPSHLSGSVQPKGPQLPRTSEAPQILAPGDYTLHASLRLSQNQLTSPPRPGASS